ncbi:hypothetical protein HYT26_02325 [Candidatus Pacearchaeota archaeon]|nr:hypothetical protein [Candidatus Pacearchaeota archaeon]
MGKRINMKSAFVELPKKFYNTLTFGELKIGDKFIILSIPGGFRNEYYVFKKIAAKKNPNLPEISDNAFRLKDGSLRGFFDCTPVIRLDD